MYAMVPASIRIGCLALLVVSCTAIPEDSNLDHEFSGVVAVTNKPYLIMRNGGELRVDVSWNSEEDAPVQVVQGALSNAQPGQGSVIELQSPPVCNQLGTWSPNNWICRPQETAGFSNPPVLFRAVASFASDAPWSELFVEINNAALMAAGGPQTTAGARSAVTIPVAINSALVATPSIQSSQTLSQLQLNQEAFVVVDAVNPGGVISRIDTEFPSHVTFGVLPTQCTLYTNTVLCEGAPLARPIHIPIVPTAASPVTVNAKFYRYSSGTYIHQADYAREITLPVIDGSATPTPTPTSTPTPTYTPTPTATPSPTGTPTATVTITPTPTPSSTPSPTSTPTPTPTPTPTSTPGLRIYFNYVPVVMNNAPGQFIRRH